jgi:hypothetical protein
MPAESVASEVVSAMVGGMFSASALYPLEVLKTRMQAESKPTSNPQEETESSSNNTTSSNNNNGGGGDEAAEKEKQTLKHQYSLAATEGMASYASLMYKHEGGIPPFYAGVGTSAIQSATEKALYFFAYTFFKNGWVGFVNILFWVRFVQRALLELVNVEDDAITKKNRI